MVQRVKQVILIGLDELSGAQRHSHLLVWRQNIQGG
jgi:hypothetical protein